MVNLMDLGNFGHRNIITRNLKILIKVLIGAPINFQNLPMKITLEVGVSKTIFQVWLQLKQELM